MEEGLADSLTVAKDSLLIKDAQKDIGKLDILVCGECHGVFHFIEQFQEHKSELNCAKESALLTACEYEDKSQIWGFLLWKNKELQSLSEKPLNSWFIYQKWCGLSQVEKDLWIRGGKMIQSFYQIRNAKVQEVKFKVRREDTSEAEPLQDPLAITDNDLDLLSPEPSTNDLIKSEIVKPVKLNNDVTILPSKKENRKRGLRTKNDEKQEYVVEAIIGKRFNNKRKVFEYKVKWEHFDDTECTWEPPEHLKTCKNLVDEFENKLKNHKFKNEKSKQAADFAQMKKAASELLESSTGRPLRTSKQKALNQVKAWCGGSVSDDESGSLKRSRDEGEESDDSMFEKRIKMEAEETSDSSYVGSDHDVKKSPVAKKAAAKASIVMSPSALKNGFEGKKLPDNVLIPDAQGIVRINQKQLPSLSSGVYIMSKTAGIIKLDSQTSKIAASGGQAIVKVAPKIGQTHIRIVKKDGASTNKIIPIGLTSPIKNTFTSSPASKSKATILKSVTKKGVQKELSFGKIARTTSSSSSTKDFVKELLKSPKMEDDESDGVPEMEFPPADAPLPQAESPPHDFTLDPLSGKLAGVEYPAIDPEPKIYTKDNVLDNIVKLAAADITEDDLKMDTEFDTSSSPVAIKTEETTTVVSSTPARVTMTQSAAKSSGVVRRNSRTLPIVRPPALDIKTESHMVRPGVTKKIITVSPRKAPTMFNPTNQYRKSVSGSPINANKSYILERTLQSPKPLTRSPYVKSSIVNRVVNPVSSTPKQSPASRSIVRGGSGGGSYTVTRPKSGSRARQIPQQLYMSSPSSRFNATIIKNTFPKANSGAQMNMSRKLGNIGGTSIYKKLGHHHQQQQQYHSPAQYKPSPQRTYNHAKTSVVRKQVNTNTPPQVIHQVMRTTVKQSPIAVTSVVSNVRKPVISMPSLGLDDDDCSAVIAASKSAAEPTVIASVPPEAEVEEEAAAATATVAASESETADLSSFNLNDGEAPIFITGDDGTVYQVAGQNEHGQTILLTQGADGQQQCLLVTSESVTQEDGQQHQEDGEETTTAEHQPEGEVHEVEGTQHTEIEGETHEDDQHHHVQDMVECQSEEEEHHQHEAVEGETVTDVTEQLSVRTEDTSDHVVAQVVRAEPPSPGGTHKVVVMLPDGNLMVTQVTPEEYASLELDK